MRASNDGEHISGAEDIVHKDRVSNLMAELFVRTLTHPNGKAGKVNIKIEVIDREIKRVSALPVTTIEVDSAEKGWDEVKEQLKKILLTSSICCIDEIISTFKNSAKTRGAIIYNIRKKKFIEPVRVSNIGTDGISFKKEKNHFAEALTLASKTAGAKGIIGEICISDDPDYVTGYVASKQFGYVRITKLKQIGDKWGGRIYLYDGDDGGLVECIDYLKEVPVIITDIPNSPNAAIRNATDLRLTNAIDSIKHSNAWRKIRVRNSNTSFDGINTVLMASNDYLGLSQHSEVKAAAAKAIKTYGTGTGASRFITGTLPSHMEFEKSIAKFKGAESAVLFNTGYSANIGVIPAVASLGGVILSDELNHASIIDGCRLSKAETIIYRHNDMTDLEAKAKQYAGQGGLIVSDAVFSMDGDIANLPKLIEIADKYRYYLMIDEAHSTGVLGKTGRGITEHFGCRNPDIIMGTCSKALGSEGGFVCGSNLIIEYLINSARSFIFSTAIAPAGAAAAAKALEVIIKKPERIKRLRENIDMFCKELNMINNQTPIIPIIIGDEKRAVEISDKLLNFGYFIPAIRYPTVEQNKARLRVTLSSEHTIEQILGVIKAIKELINE